MQKEFCTLQRFFWFLQLFLCLFNSFFGFFLGGKSSLKDFFFHRGVFFSLCIIFFFIHAAAYRLHQGTRRHIQATSVILNSWWAIVQCRTNVESDLLFLVVSAFCVSFHFWGGVSALGIAGFCINACHVNHVESRKSCRIASTDFLGESHKSHIKDVNHV